MAAASQTRWWVSLSWADAHAKGRGRRGLGEGGHAGDKPGRVGSAKVCGRLKRAQASSSERTRVRFGAEGKEEAGFILASVPLAVIGGAADQGRRTRGEAPLARARGGTWGRARLVALPLRGGPLALSSSSPLTLEQTQQSALASAWHHALPPSKGLALQSTRPLVPRCRPSRHHSTTPRSARPLALQQQLPRPAHHPQEHQHPSPSLAPSRPHRPRARSTARARQSPLASLARATAATTTSRATSPAHSMALVGARVRPSRGASLREAASDAAASSATTGTRRRSQETRSAPARAKRVATCVAVFLALIRTHEC